MLDKYHLLSQKKTPQIQNFAPHHRHLQQNKSL